MKTESELVEQQEKIEPLPVCPHCGQDPASVTIRQFMLGNAKTALLFCGNPECRTILTVQVLAFEQPRVLAPDLVIRPS